MLSEIVVTSIVNTLEFFETKGKVILDIPSSLGVEHQVLVLMPPKIFGLESQRLGIVGEAFLPPFFIGFRCGTRVDEVLHLHLLKFAFAENKLSRRNFVTERLTDLRDTKRHFDPRRIEHVFEIDVDSLTGLTPEVGWLSIPTSSKVPKI